MTAEIIILDHVRSVLENTPGMSDQIKRDLETAFPDCGQVTVYALVNGFAVDHAKKVILAVEARTSSQSTDGPGYRSFIAKVGLTDLVSGDFDGWSQVVRDRRTSPRMFLPLRRVPLPSSSPSEASARCAVLYENASQYYRVGTTTENVLNLHDATVQAIGNNFYTVDSLIRVVREIFQELGQSFYSFARIDTAASGFYREKLRLTGDKSPSVHRWKDDLAPLRRAATWLLGANTPPTHPEEASYLDPYDYVLWVLEHGCPPPTLVGPSHGDLHGMNILLDSAGDKDSSFRDVQSPTLIDYGDMGMKNVPVWDFVKLETELKVRLLRKLYERSEVLGEVFSCVGESGPFSRLVARWRRLEHSGRLPDIDEENRWILFVLLFEQRLSRRLAQLFESDDLSDDRRLFREAANSASSLVAAELVLHAIRRESARWLCRSRGRTSCDEWRDEFDFGLGVYGLSTAKFPDNSYLRWNRLAALVSAGVAMKRFERRNQLVAKVCDQTFDGGPQPSYMIPLFHGYRAWRRSRDWERATVWFKNAVEQFPTSVPLVRDYALMLASHATELDKHEDDRGQKLRAQAQSLLDDVVTTMSSPTDLPAISEAFDDFELPSRAGRICKDLADWDWKTYYPNLRPQQFGPRLARQYYAAARDYYRAAFQMSQDHYPGGNYAVTALLCGDAEEGRTAAGQVAAICNAAPLRQMDAESQFWVLATEATMALILEQSTEAASFMAGAIALTNEDRQQGLQSTYDQFCRLYCALEAKLFDPLLAELKNSSVQPHTGPLTDCGGYTTPK